MNIKHLKIANTFIIFLVCFLVHFVYTIIPNNFTAIFFPVNESIWEHMKMLFTSYMLASIIEYIIIKYKKIEVKNYLLNLFITGILSIPIYLLMFLPLQIKHSMIIILILMFITISITQIISYYILTFKTIKYSNVLGISLIIISYIIFGYLTYNPIKSYLFFDTEEEKYGLNTYNI